MFRSCVRRSRLDHILHNAVGLGRESCHSIGVAVGAAQYVRTEQRDIAVDVGGDIRDELVLVVKPFGFHHEERVVVSLGIGASGKEGRIQVLRAELM